ncbi:MAG: M3 family metallopeptidase [Porphyromonas sp.]|nr:M3 family metallopeptidase [Porphyromonas sp.]
MNRKTNITYPDFSDLSTAYLSRRITDGIEAHKREVAEIKRVSQEDATFENVILALEQSGQELDKASNLFFNLLHTDSTDERQAEAERLVPLLTEWSNAMKYDDELAQLIKTVYEKQPQLEDEADRRLLQRTYESYRDSGAYLEQEKKRELEEIKSALSRHTLAFANHVLVEQNAFSFHTENEADLKGIPPTALAIAKEKAKEKGVNGWVFDLSMPSFLAVMSYAEDRELRRRFYMARQTLGNIPEKKETYNGDLLREIARLRLRMAQILGEPTYAHLSLRKKMAHSPKGVYDMLDSLKAAYKPKAESELEEVKAFFISEGFMGNEDRLEPWDWAFASEMYRQRMLKFDAEELRPYFSLDKVIKAVFGLATKLFGVEFRLLPEAPVYRKDVSAYEVVRGSTEEVLGVLYTDFFPNSGKQNGAWMTNFSEHWVDAQGVEHLPVVSIVMNFTPPTSTQPSLLTYDEVNTFLHEFGHALHGLLTKVKHASLSGTNVVRDFVELPSQWMENFLRQPEYVVSFAHHHETEEPLPVELLEKLLSTQNFLSGYAGLRQLNFGYLDMFWHTLSDIEHIPTVSEAEAEACTATTLIQTPPEVAVSTAFNHIFSGGYAAGYYGYKWAEVLDADAFDYLLEEGLWSGTVASKFLHHILEQGDLRDPDILYREFRGRDAKIDALLKRDGVEK